MAKKKKVKMRGSVYYQTAVLTKLIFFEGAKNLIESIQIMNIMDVYHLLKRWRVIEMFGITF